MPFGIALVVAAMAAVSVFVARRAWRALWAFARAGAPASAAAAAASAAAGAAGAGAAGAGAGAERDPGPDLDVSIPGWPVGSGLSAPAADEHGERTAAVLGWARFRVVSVVALDGMAIVACRGADDLKTRNGRVAERDLSRISKPSSWPLLLATDQTLVLLVGEGNPAAQALDLLDSWRRSDAVLCLRPTEMAGGIELYDGHRFGLRAMLVSD